MSAFLRGSVILVALFVSAQGAWGASWADSMFKELSKDFGSVPRGPLLQHQFQLTNNTGQPVTLGLVRVSCGCVRASAVKSSLQPGESTSILAQMDTTRFTGTKTVTIFVQFQQPQFAEVRLWVQADGRNDFRVSPSSILFGVVKQGTDAKSKTTLTFYGRGDAKITGIKAESNYIRPTTKEIQRQVNEVSYEITANARKDIPVGRWYSDFWVSTNVPGMTKIRIPLTIEIQSPLSISPQQLLIGPIKVKERGERKLIVRGNTPFKILRVENAGKEITIRENTSAVRPVHVLSVRVESDKPAEWTRRLRIITDLEAQQSIDFLVQARIVP